MVAGGLSRRSAPGYFLAALGGALVARGASGHCPVMHQMGITTAQQAPQPVEVSQTVTVLRPRDEVYAFWRNLGNLPRFMEHLARVEDLGDGRSRWVAAGPGPGPDLEWEVEITEERPSERLAWRSVDGAAIAHAGSVHVAPGPHGGTEVRVHLSYRPPAGHLSADVARWLGPALGPMIEEDIRRSKHLLEAGELPATEGQPPTN